MTQQERRAIATKDIWQKGLDTLRATRRQTMIVAACGLIVPQLVLGLAFDAASAGTVAELREVFAEKAMVAGVGFEQLVAPALGFVTRFAASMLAIILAAMTAYFAMAHIVVRHHRDETPPTPGAALAYGLRMALTKGIWIGLAVASLIFIGQFLVAPALLVAILSLAVPIMMVAERHSAWRSLMDALSLRYVRGTGFSSWNVFFTLMSLAAFLYAAVALTSLLVNFLLHADEFMNLTRGLWTLRLPGLPFGPVYIVTVIVEATALSAALTLMPALTGAVYFTVVSPPPVRVNTQA